MKGKCDQYFLKKAVLPIWPTFNSETRKKVCFARPDDILQNVMKRHKQLTIAVFTSKFEIKPYRHGLLNDTIK